MTILALELSSALGSIAFRRENGVSVVRQFPADRKHSGLFFESLSAIRAAHGLPQIIVVGLGPGSYAGVRIAIATALGLKAATGARLLGLPSICAFEPEEYVAIGDARRNSYFFARVVQGRCVEGPTLASEAEVRAKLAEWPELPKFADQPLPQFSEIIVAHPSALRLAELALVGEGGDEETLEPIYLREPYITTPRK